MALPESDGMCATFGGATLVLIGTTVAPSSEGTWIAAMNSALYAGLLSCRLSKFERCQHHGNAGKDRQIPADCSRASHHR